MGCSSAKLFYSIRQFLIARFGARRDQVTIRAPLSSWLEPDDWSRFLSEFGWSGPSVRRHWLTGRPSLPCAHVGDLVWTLWSANLAELSPPHHRSVDVWIRFRRQVANTLGLDEEQVYYHHHFVADLGLD